MVEELICLCLALCSGCACSCCMTCTGLVCMMGPQLWPVVQQNSTVMISRIPGTGFSLKQPGRLPVPGPVQICVAWAAAMQHWGTVSCALLPGSDFMHVQVQCATLSIPAGCPGRTRRRETASVLRWASQSMWSCCRSQQKMQRQHRWCSLGTTGPMTERGRRSAKRFRRHPFLHGRPLAQNLPFQSLLLAQSESDQPDVLPGPQ